ncbi:MAG: amino acid ABC transporter permease [Rhodospirillaceae bacterium]|nr:amino acid ABC transporter permease [Rhodospirillaceae bacterium]
MRQNLFNSLLNSVLTFVVLFGIYLAAVPLYHWGIGEAVWEAASRRECLDRSPGGACWAGVLDWSTRFIYGRYPDAEIWRVDLGFAIFLAWMVPLWLPRVTSKAVIGFSVALIYPFLATYLFLGGERGLFSQIMVAAGIMTFAAVELHVLACLVTGKSGRHWIIRLSGLAKRDDKFHKYPVIAVLGLLFIAAFAASYEWQEPEIWTYKWGGLFLTLVIAGIAIASALPAGIILAFGRRSRMPFIRTVSIAYIELVRSVPLVTVLFMWTTMLPLFLPEGMLPNKLVSAIVAISVFASAYTAEIVRGGLQAIPIEQIEAARAIGLSHWQSLRLVVMPQALRLMIPNIVGEFQGLVKGTTIVTIFGFQDLMGMLRAVSAQPIWINLFYEPMFVAAAFYFVACFGLSKYSRYLERTLGDGLPKRVR